MTRDPRLPPEDLRLGAILVRSAGLPLKTLQEALDRQKKSGEKLGAILCEMSAITADQLQHALELQAKLTRQRAAE